MITPEVKAFITQRAGTTKTEKAQLDELIAACESLPIPVTQGDIQAAMAEALGSDSLRGAKPIAKVREEILNRAKSNRLGFPNLSPLDFLCACVAGRFPADQRGPIRELRKALLERSYQVSDLYAVIRKHSMPDPTEWTLEAIGQVLQLVENGPIGVSSQASTVIVAQGEVTTEETPLVTLDPTPPTDTASEPEAATGKTGLAEVRDSKCVVCSHLFASSTSPSPNTCSVCLDLQSGANSHVSIEKESQVGASLAEHAENQEPTPLSEATPREDAAPHWHPPLDEWPGSIWRPLAKGSEGARIKVIGVGGFGVSAEVSWKTMDDPQAIEHTTKAKDFAESHILVSSLTLTKKEKEPCLTASPAATAPSSESLSEAPAIAETGSSASTEPSTSAPSAEATAGPSATPPTPDAPSIAPSAAAAPTLLTFPTSASLEDLRELEAELEATIQAHQQELDQVRAAIADEERLGEKRRKLEELRKQMEALQAELGESA